MLRSIPKMLAKSLCTVLEGIEGAKDKELYSLCFPILCDLPAYVRRGRLTGLTEDERKVKAIMQTILIRAGVLRNDSEEEWNLWTTRKVIHSEWPKLMKIAVRLQSNRSCSGRIIVRAQERERRRLEPTPENLEAIRRAYIAELVRRGVPEERARA